MKPIKKIRAVFLTKGDFFKKQAGGTLFKVTASYEEGDIFTGYFWCITYKNRAGKTNYMELRQDSQFKVIYYR